MPIRARRTAAAVGALVIAATVALAASPVAAQVPPDPAPNAGIPGSSLITELLGWLKYGALASAVAGLLIGAIVTGFGYSSSHYGSSSAGRNWLMGGLAAAVIAGLAHTVAIALYRAT